MASLYILFLEKLNNYYIGSCINLDSRIYEHSIGHSKFTSKGTIWGFVHQETFDDLTAAKRRESQIKKMKSRKYIEALIAST